MLAETVEEWTRAWTLDGERKGKSSLLMRQLQWRFGTLPLWVSEKMAQAELPVLDEWGLRFVDARSLTEVFADHT